MNTQKIIMVLIDDREWTLEALHCACLMARNTEADIVLVQMIPVQHLSWLGVEWISTSLTSQQLSAFAYYQSIIEDYAVELTPLVLQYTTLAEAIVQAAERVNAQIVFAQIPKSIIPFRTRFQRWSLQRHLAGLSCQWVQHLDPVTRTSSINPGSVTEINSPVEHRV